MLVLAPFFFTAATAAFVQPSLPPADFLFGFKVPEDIYVIEKGLSETDKIVLEGIRQVRDGDKVEYEDRPPEQVAEHLKFHAE